jgi:hypothetical protein
MNRAAAVSNYLQLYLGISTSDNSHHRKLYSWREMQMISSSDLIKKSTKK